MRLAPRPMPTGRGLTQSFGARFLAHGAPWDPNGGATPSHGLTLPIFDGLDKMQVWHEGAEQNTP
jgi:hypothetical protein